MSENVIALYTYKSEEEIKEVGGSQSWVLTPERASACKYAVVCRNRGNPHAAPDVPHGHAFMVGLVKDVVPSTDTRDRWLVRFSHYAVGDFGKQWKGRNPVAYWNTDDYTGGDDGEGEEWRNLDFAALKFEPMPEAFQIEDAPVERPGMNLADAKDAVARYYGVDLIAVEICVRA